MTPIDERNDCKAWFESELEPELIRAGHDRAACMIHPDTHQYELGETVVAAWRHFRDRFPGVRPIRCRVGQGPPVLIPSLHVSTDGRS